MKLLKFAREKPLLGIALGIAIFSLGALLVKLPRAIASQNWPITQGMIISSEVVESYGYDGESWHADVSYRYSVNGREYVSDDVAVRDFGSGDTDLFAQKTVRRYPVGKEVLVHYAPNNPAVSVLEPGMPKNPVAFVVAFVIMWVGVLVFVVSLYSMQKHLT